MDYFLILLLTTYAGGGGLRESSLRPKLFQSLPNRSNISSLDMVTACWRGKTMKSAAITAGLLASCNLKLSRTRRLSRLRCTARRSTFRDTAMPSRELTWPLGLARILKQLSEAIQGFSKISRKARFSVRRYWCGRLISTLLPGIARLTTRRPEITLPRYYMPRSGHQKSVSLGRSCWSGAETFAAFGPASSENGAATTGCHTCAKAVTAGTNQAAGLKCTFHDKFLS